MSDQEATEVVSGAFSKKIEPTYSGVLEKSSKNGLSWTIQYSTELAAFDSFKKMDSCLYFMWNFEWNETFLKRQGYDGYEATVVAGYTDTNKHDVCLPFQFELIHSGKWIQRRIGTYEETKNTDYGSFRRLTMKFSLKKFAFEAKNVASNFNDAVLVVEGRKIDVNKKYLSMHSEYFDKLFNSEFKEKSMPEIPINDVNYADFSRLLGTIHPTDPVLPTDENIVNLLDLADRFMLPSVTERVVNHLRYSSDLPFMDFLLLIDKYNMDKLWDLIVKPINSGQRMQLLTKHIECKELSETAKLKLFDQFADVTENARKNNLF